MTSDDIRKMYEDQLRLVHPQYANSYRSEQTFRVGGTSTETIIQRCFEAQLDAEEREYIKVTVSKSSDQEGNAFYIVCLRDPNDEVVERYTVQG